MIVGGSAGNQINLSLTNFTGTVTFGYSAPAGITCAFLPNFLSYSGSTAITVSVPSTVPAGPYTHYGNGR